MENERNKAPGRPPLMNDYHLERERALTASIAQQKSRSWQEAHAQAKWLASSSKRRDDAK